MLLAPSFRENTPLQVVLALHCIQLADSAKTGKRIIQTILKSDTTCGKHLMPEKILI